MMTLSVAVNFLEVSNPLYYKDLKVGEAWRWSRDNYDPRYVNIKINEELYLTYTELGEVAVNSYWKSSHKSPVIRAKDLAIVANFP